VWVVHGADGLDEITTTGPTRVVALAKGDISEFEVKPEDAGLPRAKPEDLRGGEPEYNANELRAVLDGKPGAYRDISLLNAAAALIVAGRAATLRQGADMAADAIASGKAKATLAKLIETSGRT
jgi:anthranilate phosphoribosyltransferase